MCVEGISIKFISHCSLSLVAFFLCWFIPQCSSIQSIHSTGRQHKALSMRPNEFTGNHYRFIEIWQPQWQTYVFKYETMHTKCNDLSTCVIHHGMCLIAWTLSWMQMHSLLYNKLNHGIFLRFLNLRFGQWPSNWPFSIQGIRRIRTWITNSNASMRVDIKSSEKSTQQILLPQILLIRNELYRFPSMVIINQFHFA